MSLQNTIIEKLSETYPKIRRMRRNVGEFKRNVGKVVIFLQSFEYDDIKDMPSYEASILLLLLLLLLLLNRTHCIIIISSDYTTDHNYQNPRPLLIIA